MGADEIMGLLALIALVVLPSLALTTRLALRPMVDALLRLREGFLRSAGQEDTARVERLEAEVRELQAEVARLGATESFYRELAGSAEAPVPAAAERPENGPTD